MMARSIARFAYRTAPGRVRVLLVFFYIIIFVLFLIQFSSTKRRRPEDQKAEAAERTRINMCSALTVYVHGVVIFAGRVAGGDLRGEAYAFCQEHGESKQHCAVLSAALASSRFLVQLQRLLVRESHAAGLHRVDMEARRVFGRAVGP